jgi:hypothetical protein
MTDPAISEVTRRDIIDELRLQKTCWSGRLDEVEFLNRIFDLAKLPSYDHRQKTMAGDIRMHRESFLDWEDDWVYLDHRLNLLRCADEVFLRFLCEIVHPLVRVDEAEAQKLVEMFNGYLNRDGYEIAPRTAISGRPIYAGRRRNAAASQIALARKVAEELSSDYVAGLITRMEAAVEGDPFLAIGSAKEFVESICKGILAERGQPTNGNKTLPQLVKATRQSLGLAVSSQTEETLRQMLSGLGQITQGIAELRGQLGTGHGHHPGIERPLPSVARLSVNAAIALGIFLFETHQTHEASNGPENRNNQVLAGR